MSSTVFFYKTDTLPLNRGTKLPGMILLSFFVHALFFSTLFFMAPKPLPRSSLPISYPVSLVSLKAPQTDVETKAVETDSSPPLIKKIDLPQKETAKAIFTKKRVKPKAIPAVPLVSQPPPLPSSDIVVPPPIEEIPPQQNPASFVEEKKAVVPPLPDIPLLENKKNEESMTASVNAIAVEKEKGEKERAASPSMEGSLLNYPYYFRGITNKISAQWAPPPLATVAAKKETVAVIRFIVKRDGRIDRKSVKVEKGSGNAFFDTAALRAIYNADPLLPLPKAMTEELHIHFEFKLSLGS